MQGMGARVFLIAVLFVMLAAAALAQPMGTETTAGTRSRVIAFPALAREYLRCSAQSDCTAGFAGCTPIAVNRRYADLFSRAPAALTAGIRCGTFLDPRLAPACISGTCALTPVDFEDDYIKRSRPTWCVTVADCTVITDYCGHYHAVNAAHRDEQQAIYDRYAARGSCEWVETRPILEQRCTDNSCRVLLDNNAR
jgi:hypothetical protein